jgi:hypothetical protein
MSNVDKASDEENSIIGKLQVDDKDTFLNEDSEQPTKKQKVKSSNNKRTIKKTIKRRDPNEVKSINSKGKEMNTLKLQDIIKRQAIEINKIIGMLKPLQKSYGNLEKQSKIIKQNQSELKQIQKHITQIKKITSTKKRR